MEPTISEELLEPSNVTTAGKSGIFSQNGGQNTFYASPNKKIGEKVKLYITNTNQVLRV